MTLAETNMQNKFNEAVSEMQSQYVNLADNMTTNWKTELSEARSDMAKSEKESARIQQQMRTESLEFQQIRQLDSQKDSNKDLWMRSEAQELQEALRRTHLEQEASLHKAMIEKDQLRSSFANSELQLGATLAASAAERDQLRTSLMNSENQQGATLAA